LRSYQIMKPKSFFKKLFLGYEVIEKVNSPINGEITVVEDLFGKREMRIGKVTQSGGLVEKLWGKILNFKFLIFNQFLNSNFKCLILGLGCGTVAKLISNKFPKTKMVGVEIDPEVVKIGKKYFDLGKIDNLEIIVGDAFKPEKWEVRNGKLDKEVRGENYDLILVDLYLGQEFPKEAESDDFLSGLKKVLNKNGLVIFNRLYYNYEHQREAEEFLKKLKNVFPNIQTRKILTNMLIFASKY